MVTAFGTARSEEFRMLASDVGRLNIMNAATLLKNVSNLVSLPMQFIERDTAITAAALLAVTDAVTAAEYVSRMGVGGNRQTVDGLKQKALASISALQAIVTERAKPNDRARAMGLA